MTGNHILQIILNLMVVVILFVILYIFVDITLEKYEEMQDEPCLYDPKVQELKQIVEKWMESRLIPWTGHLECLNHKKKETIKHLRMCKGSSSYTIDKEQVYLCVKDDNDEYYDYDMLMHVLLHELAHAICDEIGHTKKFDDIFTDLMDEAHNPSCTGQKPIYDKKAPLDKNYCGTNASDSYSA
jgi:hypothetical protein|uniref:WLM domain-containing protein n=1 Tax=viral metagenome TaxID=1070528 RepID=A0A6C0LU95_9ZZZZ